jgi:DNA-binding transcriptional LysR family regulator
MELHEAQAFVAVARERSFTRASLHLHRSQPAVSQAVAALERELGTALFERRPREARPTAAGEALLARLEPLLAAWQGVGAQISEALSQAPAGELRIGAGETALLHLLPAPLRRFRELHPAVRLVLRHQRREESLRDLEAGTLDLAVRSATEIPASAPRISAEPLLEIPRIVIAAADHPLATRQRLAWRQVASAPWVLPPGGSDSRLELAKRFAAAGDALNVAVETAGWELVKRYVALGLGLSVVPEIALTRGDRRSLARLAVSPRLPPERFFLWLGRESALRPATRVFVGLLRESLRTARAATPA